MAVFGLLIRAESGLRRSRTPSASCQPSAVSYRLENEEPIAEG